MSSAEALSGFVECPVQNETALLRAPSTYSVDTGDKVTRKADHNRCYHHVRPRYANPDDYGWGINVYHERQPKRTFPEACPESRLLGHCQSSTNTENMSLISHLQRRQRHRTKKFQER